MTDDNPIRLPKNVKDLTGKVFGHLTAIKYLGLVPHSAIWLCQCSCGGTKNVRTYRLLRGQVKSCGCLLGQRHPGVAGHSGTATYRTWLAMLRRCHNPKARENKWYSARGIIVCERWRESFLNFLADMGERPEGTSIDRFPDQNGNYEPSNCRWATITEQNNNKRTNRLLTVNGETRTLAEWSRLTGLKQSTISERLRKGRTPEDAVTTPLQTRQ